MNNRVVLSLLSDHADALNDAEDPSEFDSRAWLSGHAPSQKKQSLLLLELAQAIKRALVPVTTPQPFRSELRQLLDAASPAALTVKRSYHRALLWGAASVGLFLILLRRIRVGQTQRQAHSVSSAI
jgi:hypothetical protein